MPPYTATGKRPHNQRRTPRVVMEILACNWCKRAGAKPCPACTLPTCYRCLASMEAGRCTHVTYKPAQSTGWGVDCTNTQCNPQCELCSGRGTLWT